MTSLVKLERECTTALFPSTEIETKNSIKDKLQKLWFNYSDKTNMKFTTWSKTFSDTIETMMVK